MTALQKRMEKLQGRISLTKNAVCGSLREVQFLAGYFDHDAKTTLRTPAEGRTIAVVGDVYRFLATGEDTNGNCAVWEAIVPPGGGPPPHVHSRQEEGFSILEGEITFQIGDKRVVATAGMVANMPLGTPICSRMKAVNRKKC